MRFSTYQPRGRFRTTKTDPYQFDLPVIGGGVVIVLTLVIFITYVLPLIMQRGHELPELERMVRHQYPSEALAQRLEGEVIVQFSVDPDGNVSDPVVPADVTHLPCS